MTKDDINNYLSVNGASKILIQMPAVMERIYAYFEIMPKNIYSRYTGTIIPMNRLLPKQITNFLKVEPNGNITIINGADKRRFEVRPEGEAVYIKEDEGIMGIDKNGEYKIDKYGMDKSFESEDGVIVSRSDKGRITCKSQEFADDGSPILNVEHYLDKMLNRDAELSEMWDVNREELTANYPNTIEWFDSRESTRLGEYQKQEGEIVIKGLVDDFRGKINIPKPEEMKEDDKKRSDDEKDKDETIAILQERDAENSAIIVTLRSSNQRKDRRIEELEIENNQKDGKIRDLQTETAEREQRIADLQTRNSDLQIRNDDLQKRNTRLQQMLSTAIDKLQQIKASIFGRFFFTREERREAKKAKRLPEGKGSR